MHSVQMHSVQIATAQLMHDEVALVCGIHQASVAHNVNVVATVLGVYTLVKFKCVGGGGEEGNEDSGLVSLIHENYD